MAEKLIIDINLNGSGSGGTGGRAGSGQQNYERLGGAALGLGIMKYGQVTRDGSFESVTEKDNNVYTRFAAKNKIKPGELDSLKHSRQGFVFRKNTLYADEIGPTRLEDMTSDELQKRQVASYRQFAPTKAAVAVGGAVAATGVKMMNSHVSYLQHTSGDSYKNDQMSVNMKLLSMGVAIGTAFAINPVLGAATAALTIVNEGINAYTDNKKYNWDRKVEAGQIANINTIVGDLTYGRRGGR